MSGLLLLLLSVWIWPGPLAPHWWGLRLLSTLFLLWQCWSALALVSPPAFSLTPGGEGRWLADGRRFALTSASRLLPRIALLRVTSEQGRQWYWCHQDSFEERHWRRLCRAVLRVQRDGTSTVG